MLSIPPWKSDGKSDFEDRVEEDNMEDMIRDVGVETFAQTHVYETMSADAETPLYVGSTKLRDYQRF